VIPATAVAPVACIGLSDAASDTVHFVGEGPVVVEVDVCPQAAVTKAARRIP
jgi:hypothetical protein